MEREKANRIIDAISDLRDEAVVYGMLLEENDGYVPCSNTEEVDVAIRRLAKILGISEFCEVRNGYIHKKNLKDGPQNIAGKIKQYGVHPKGWSPELEEKIKRRNKNGKSGC